MIDHILAVEIYSLFATQDYEKGQNLTPYFLALGGDHGLYQSVDSSLQNKRKLIDLYFTQKALGDSIGFISLVTLSDGRMLKDSTVVRW